MEAIEALLRGHGEVVADALAESILAGWLGGANATAGLLGEDVALPPDFTGAGSPPILPPPITGSPDAGQPPEDFPGLARAVESLQRRKILEPAEFYELSASAKQQAFTITGDLTDQTRERIRDMLSADIEGPANRGTFTERVRREFDSLPISDAHLEHVYRNAANQAYSQGQDHVLDHPMVADAFPYRAYFAIHDTRAREEHRQMEKLGLNGTNVYHKDDPTWQRFKPPWDYNCRCGSAPLSVRDAARLGVKEAQQWLETGVEPVHEWVTPPPFAPSPSWDTHHVAV